MSEQQTTGGATPLTTAEVREALLRYRLGPGFKHRGLADEHERVLGQFNAWLQDGRKQAELNGLEVAAVAAEASGLGYTAFFLRRRAEALRAGKQEQEQEGGR